MMDVTIYTYAVSYGMTQMKADLVNACPRPYRGDQQLFQFLQIARVLSLRQQMLYNHLHERG